jgi:hypothetical protein
METEAGYGGKDAIPEFISYVRCLILAGDM